MNVHDLEDLGGGTLTGLLARRARQAPDNPALLFEGREYSYAELNREADRLGSALMAQGLGKGDVLGVFLGNRPEYLFTTLGSSRAGLVNVSINNAYKGEFLHYALEHSGVQILITDSRLAQAVAQLDELPPTLRTLVYLGDEAPGIDAPGLRVLSWAELLAGASDAPQFPRVEYHDIGAISFTSCPNPRNCRAHACDPEHASIPMTHGGSPATSSASACPNRWRRDGWSISVSSSSTTTCFRPCGPGKTSRSRSI